MIRFLNGRKKRKSAIIGMQEEEKKTSHFLQNLNGWSVTGGPDSRSDGLRSGMEKDMRKRVLGTFLTGIMLASQLLACAGTGQEEKTEESSVQSGGDQGEALIFTYWGSTAEKEVIEKILAKFTEDTGIEVEGMHIPDDYETKLTALVAAGEAPDLGYLAIPTAYTWYEDHVIADFNDILAADEEYNPDDYLDTAMVYYDDEKIMGILTAIEGTAIFYNKEMFKAAGVEAPQSLEENWTWDEFVEVARKLTLDSEGRNAADPGFDPENIVQYAMKWDLGQVTLDSIAKNNGASYIAEDETSGWTSPEMVEVVQNVADLINVHHVMPSKTGGDNLPSAEIALQSGVYAMTMSGQWILNNFAQMDGLEIGIAPVPSMGKEDRMVLGSSELAIFEDSDKKEEAWLLAKYLTDPANAPDVYAGGLWMPIRRDWYEDEELIAQWVDNEAHPDEYREFMLEPVRDNGEYLSELYVKNFNRMWDVLNPALENLWNGRETSAETVLKSIESDLDELTEGTYGKIGK